MTTSQPAVNLSMPASDNAPAETLHERDSAEADAMQLAQLDIQLRALEAKALELIAAATALEAELGPAACHEVEHAQREAGFMRSTAETARAEINSAPTDPRTGKKKITAASITKLTDTIGHLILGAESEKKALTEASVSDEKSESKSLAKSVTKCAVAAVTTTATAVHKLPGLSLGGHATASSSIGASLSAAGARIDHGIASATSFIKETWASVTASPAVQSVKATASKMWDGTVHAVTHPIETAKAAASSIKQTAVSAYDTVAAAAHEYVGKPVVKAYEVTRYAANVYVLKPIAGAYESTRSAAVGAKDWVVGLFSGKEEVKPPVAVAKIAPPKPANDNKQDQSMLNALRQAAASVSLAVIAGGHSVTEIVGSNVPNLSTTGHSLSHFWQ